MDEKARWKVGEVQYADRMPPLATGDLSEKQRRVAEELAKGPRGGVKGPFVPLLRSPDLVERLGKLGEYLRFGSSLEARTREFVMLVISREWTNQFEWAVHVPLALKSGVAQETVDALAEGRRPKALPEEEDIAYDVCDELNRTRSLCGTTYRRAVAKFGESGLLDIAAVYGYFVTMCAIMNLAHTPPPSDTGVAPILPYPL
jgi:4-carboxymuconolactone decarboxylase